MKTPIASYLAVLVVVVWRRIGIVRGFVVVEVGNPKPISTVRTIATKTTTPSSSQNTYNRHRQHHQGLHHAALADPNTWIPHAVEMIDQIPQLIATAATSTTSAATGATTTELNDLSLVWMDGYSESHHSSLESLLSTLYSTGIAHGHENPWFGPANPYLEAGRSIAPSIPPTGGVVGTGGSVAIPTDSGMDALMEFKGYSFQTPKTGGLAILDASKISRHDALPGLLGRPIPPSSSSLSTFMAQTEWVNSFVGVLDRLPAAALTYCLVEFSVVQMGFVPTVTWAVRSTVLTIVALLTLALFG